MRRWARIAGLGAGLVMTAAFAAYAARTLQHHDLGAFHSPVAVAAIGIAALCYASIIPMSAWAWRGLLADMGTLRTWRELGIIMGITQMAKYVPGNIGQHIGRAGMAIGKGIGVGPLTASVTVEALLAVLAAVAVGLGCIGMSHAGLRVLSRENAVLVMVAAAAVGALVIGLALARRVLPRLLRRLSVVSPVGAERPLLPGFRSMALAFAVYCANYLAIGIGIFAMARLLLPQSPQDPLLLAGSFALAWIVGFFTPGAPAGLGVREGVMLAMLHMNYLSADALVVIIALRLATTLGDAICFLASLALAARDRANLRRAGAGHGV